MEPDNHSASHWDTPPSHTPHLHAQGAGRGKRSKKRLAFIVASVVVIIALLGGGAYLLFGGKQSTSKKSSTTKTIPTTTQPKMNEQAASVTKTYKSTKLNVEFTYRSDWTMRENADKTEVILTSPSVNYTKKDGTATEGPFTLKLRNGLVPNGMQANIQNAVAIKDSEVIAYSAPTEQQRQYTNISFAGNSNNFLFLLVTGSISFKNGEAFGSNIDTQGNVYLFAGGYGTDANDALAFDAVPAASFDTVVYQQAVSVIKSLKIY